MTYAEVALVALLVHCIVNYSALRNRHYRNATSAGKLYRWLMLSVGAFYVFDILWGLFYDAGLTAAVFGDTVLYFAAMTATVFLWTRYVIEHLREENGILRGLRVAGWIFLGAVAAALVLNCFLPVMFWFDEAGVYHASKLRYVILAMQVLLFLATAVYVLVTAKGKTPSVRRHHLAIGFFGITMAVMVILQVISPLLPMYSVGCLLGCSILHTYVLEELKEDRRLELEEQVRREEAHLQELGSAKQLAFRDPLTGVKNKHAYVQWEKSVDEAIAKGEKELFGVVVCDVNNLKTVNDLYGHNEGDACIKKACARICSVFSHSPVFRIGGDEFVALLSGEDYLQRHKLLEKINVLPRDRAKIRLGETISAGLGEYDPARHQSLSMVFEEADKAMYERKRFFKNEVMTELKRTEEHRSNEVIPIINSRKHILIADDIEVNRQLMGDLLKGQYDVSYAADGEETLEVLRSRKGEIDLVLLDLQMPRKDGREVIAEMQIDEDLMTIPVLFLTVDQNAELDCLKSGAMDFIPKPYPDIEIVKARIDKCIELSEDRELIRYTERDKLTGLLNKEYFYRYVQRLDHLYKETVLDAVAIDVNRFHKANKQYGRQFCDRVLRMVGAGVKKLARDLGGIGCRQEGDTFLLYCPRQEDYEALFRTFVKEVFADSEMADRITLRFGVCRDARREPDVEERFDQARQAAEQTKDVPAAICGFCEA